jgi:hypothetical protein
MKKYFLLFTIALLYIGCDESQKSDDTTEKNKMIFNKNVSTIKEMLNGFNEENPEKFMKVFADSVRWSGPDKIKLDDYDSREVLETALTGYMSLYDNHELRDIRFFGGSAYSDTGSGSENPNAVRVFGNWHHTHTETQIDVTHKWMGIMWFDEDGKINQFSDFFDVGGFLNQHLNQ